MTLRSTFLSLKLEKWNIFKKVGMHLREEYFDNNQIQGWMDSRNYTRGMSD